MEAIQVRLAQPRDVARLAQMCHQLWPDVSPEEHARDVVLLVEGRVPGTLPAAMLVAEAGDGEAAGFLHVGLRSHADGCDPARPVGFVEGWFVAGAYRGRKLGARLMRAAEDWARGYGCREMASDTWIDHTDSQRAHQALGFEEVDRCVHYRKAL